jgi:hypothetical protein
VPSGVSWHFEKLAALSLVLLERTQPRGEYPALDGRRMQWHYAVTRHGRRPRQ